MAISPPREVAERIDCQVALGHGGPRRGDLLVRVAEISCESGILRATAGERALDGKRGGVPLHEKAVCRHAGVTRADRPGHRRRLSRELVEQLVAAHHVQARRVAQRVDDIHDATALGDVRGTVAGER